MCRHILSLVILSPKIRHSGACNSAWLWRLPIERLFRLVCLTSDSRLSLRNSSSLSNFSFWFATTRGMMKDKSLKLRLSPVYCFPAGQGLLWFRHLPSFSLYRHPSKIRVRRSRVIRRSLCLPALKGARLLLVGAAQAHCTKKNVHSWKHALYGADHCACTARFTHAQNDDFQRRKRGHERNALVLSSCHASWQATRETATEAGMLLVAKEEGTDEEEEKEEVRKETLVAVGDARSRIHSEQ